MVIGVAFLMQNGCAYICMYTLRAMLMWKQDSYCIKMRRKHQHNSSHFPTDKCKAFYAIKLQATYWVWLSWALSEPKGSVSFWHQDPQHFLHLPCSEGPWTERSFERSPSAPANGGWLFQSRFKLQLLKCFSQSFPGEKPMLQDRERMA